MVTFKHFVAFIISFLLIAAAGAGIFFAGYETGIYQSQVDTAYVGYYEDTVPAAF